MKILQVIPTLRSGGAERFVVDLANEFSKDNDVTIYVLKGNSRDNLLASLINPRIKIKFFGLKGWISLNLVFRLGSCIKELNPDIIHTHGRALHYLMPIRFRNKTLTVVYTAHNDLSRALFRSFEIELFRYFFSTKRIYPVLISQEQIRNFTKLYPKASFEEINNGRTYPEKTEKFLEVSSELHNLVKDEKTKIFINIARLSPAKNHYLLINAFKRFVTDNINAIFIIIGRAVEEHQESVLIREFVEKEVENNCTIYWLGEKTNATDYLHLADYFCLSSNTEAMPISLLEAFAIQIIPVCTKVGGIPMMIEEGKEGFLSEDLSEEAYASALFRAYHGDVEKIKTNLKIKYKENYSMERCAAKYFKYYQSILENRDNY